METSDQGLNAPFKDHCSGGGADKKKPKLITLKTIIGDDIISWFALHLVPSVRSWCVTLLLLVSPGAVAGGAKCARAVNWRMAAIRTVAPLDTVQSASWLTTAIREGAAITLHLVTQHMQTCEQYLTMFEMENTILGQAGWQTQIPPWPSLWKRGNAFSFSLQIMILTTLYSGN